MENRAAILLVALVAGVGCGGNGGPKCTDVDGDGAGPGCSAPDCDDSLDTGPGCASGCATSYADADSDGHGAGSAVVRCSIPAGHVPSHDDCDDADARHWSDCGRCRDQDGDSFGEGCDPGPDCDDSLETGRGCTSGCVTSYGDGDSDGHGAGAAVVGCSVPAGHVANADDCAAEDARHWSDCGACTDADGDGLGAGCDLGPDCDDTAATGGSCTSGCVTSYGDGDSDGHGAGAAVVRCSVPAGHVANADDCAAEDARHWSDCGACTDADGDGFGQGCDLGPDCDDTAATGSACSTGCVTAHADVDGDGHGAAAGLHRCSISAGHLPTGDDCDDADARHWSDCGACADVDDDGFGPGCDLGQDCDDASSTGGACHDGCVEVWPDGDGDGHGTGSAARRCSVPAGYAATGDDCAATDERHWSDCGACGDTDGDGFGPDCDLGSDCDETAATGSTCHDGCGQYWPDVDGDGSGAAGASAVVACASPAGHAGDHADCDDTAASGAACTSGCATSYRDGDGDGRGGNDSVARCSVPAGYVSGTGDCDDGDERHWSDCGRCDDTDGDGYGADCDLGVDCDDTTALRAPGRPEACDALDNDCDASTPPLLGCASCQQAWQASPSLASGTYTLGGASGTAFRAYCDMDADGGGWTLVLKADGSLIDSQFLYDSPLWTDQALLNAPEVQAADPQLDIDPLAPQEAKYAGFLSAPFSEVRVVMLDGAGTARGLRLAAAASSFRELMSGPFVPTTGGRVDWLGLLPGSDVQSGCNREGFNILATDPYARVRIGLVGDDSGDCASPDSYLGVGGALLPGLPVGLPQGGNSCYPSGPWPTSAGARSGGVCAHVAPAWSFSPSNSDVDNSNGTARPPRADYDGGAAFSASWTFTRQAATAGTVEVPYLFQGLHSWYMAKAFLFVLKNGAVVEKLYDGVTVSGGHSFTGVATISVAVGDTYGFQFGGSHSDASYILDGSLILFDSNRDAVWDRPDPETKSVNGFALVFVR